MRQGVLINENAVAAHFLLSPVAKTINLVRVARMSKQEAETTFALIRWSDTDGKPVCPHYGCLNAYDCRRPNGAPRWRRKAKECAREFSLTSGTLFAFHKMPLQTYLLAIAIFVTEVKGKKHSCQGAAARFPRLGASQSPEGSGIMTEFVRL